jgi:hypothetical protein
MNFGLYVDDVEGLEITIDGEAFVDAVFEGGEKANFPHEHLNLIRDVEETKPGESVGTGTIKLEPATQYIIKNMETLEVAQ